MQKPRVKDFSNYRDFLNSYVELKKTGKKWTLGVWKRQLKLKSVSTLTMILKGQRHPGKNLVQSLVEYFEFNPEERAYFESLIELQKKIKNPSSSMLMLLGSPEVLDPDSATSFNDTAPPHQLLFKRLTHILREMTLLQDFRPQAEWISQYLRGKISPDSIERFLQKLVQAGLLIRGSDGELKLPTMTVASRPEDPNVLLNFHKEILAGSLGALTQSSEAERSFNVTFLNVRMDKVAEAKKKILDFQNEFSHLFEQTPGDSVYQLSIQFFPTTRGSSLRSQNV